ncbi:MAG TPA: hypothetical protein VFJ29_02855, partial [Candidatus Kapabacteria bacterium]|nr:hypothetical protein [Candidatus Kapabacteria bacterium]
DGPMTVPAGNFMISMYSYTVNSSFTTRFVAGSIELDGRLYYARGVGLIKETNFRTLNAGMPFSALNETGGTYKELVSYSVK